MKKMLKTFIIIIIFLICINVKAITTFTNTPKFVNDYIKKFPNYQRYMVTENNKYGYTKNGNIESVIESFKTGGLLNIAEYDISKGTRNNSYIFNGLEFFTMTETDDGKIQVIDPKSINGISKKNGNETSGIRVTNYVQNGVKLEGQGTLVNPWKFIDRYNLKFSYDDTKITIKLNTSTILPFSNILVPESGKVEVNVSSSELYQYVSNDCNGVYNNGKLTISNITSDITCKIEAEQKTFTVTTHANSGTFRNANGWTINSDLTSGTKNIQYNTKIGTMPIVEKNGYTFTGWFTESDGGTQVDENTVVRGELNAYAHWEVNDYTLTYDNNGGSGCTTKTAKYNSQWGNLCTPNKTGYNFDYWYDNNNQRVTSTTIVQGNLTVTAHWTAKTPRVTFEANGGSVNPTTKTVTYDSAYGTLPTPTKDGNTFDGWYKESGLTNKIESETIVQIETNHTLYAKWISRVNVITTALCLNPEYNGTSQSIVQIAGTGYMWTSGESRIDAGSQNVVATLQTGYVWSDGTTGTKSISCSIQPKEVAVTWSNNSPFTYNGNPRSETPSVTLVQGESIVPSGANQGWTREYKKADGTSLGTSAPSATGNYTVTVTCKTVTGGQAKCSNYTFTNITKEYTIVSN